MARNTEFGQGSTGAGGGYNPVNVPSNLLDESGIVKPSSSGNRRPKLPDTPLHVQLKSADAVLGKRTVGMNSALDIASVLHQNLSVLHRDLSSRGQHPSLNSAADSLNTASGDLGQARLKKTSATSEAWGHLQDAGKGINTAMKHLGELSPKSMDTSVTHSVNGNPLKFSAGEELLHITTDPSPFRAKGKDPKKVIIGNTATPTKRAALTIRNMENSEAVGVTGTPTAREDLRRAVKKGMQGTPRVRKSERPIGPSDKQRSVTVEPVGNTATQMSKVGDWSGADSSRGAPESIIPKVDKAAASKKALNAGKTVAEKATITDKGGK